MHIIYLHGFCSSTTSFKAQLTKQYVEDDEKHSLFLINLSFCPVDAMAILEAHIATLGDKPWGLIGSSLGGFYATYLGEKYNKKSVLINPAVFAHELLSKVLGKNKNYHSGETFLFTQEHLDQLESMHVPTVQQPNNILLLTQTGDEVLDYKQGVEDYKGCKQIIIEGGDHGFSNYAQYLDKTFEFLQRT